MLVPQRVLCRALPAQQNGSRCEPRTLMCPHLTTRLIRGHLRQPERGLPCERLFARRLQQSGAGLKALPTKQQPWKPGGQFPVQHCMYWRSLDASGDSFRRICSNVNCGLTGRLFLSVPNIRRDLCDDEEDAFNRSAYEALA